MRIFKEHDFGQVIGHELGWSPVGRPLMTTICYRVGPVMIDTGPPHMRAAVLDLITRNRLEAILLTHYHEDHSGNSAAIRNLGLPVFAGEQTAEKLRQPYKIFPYQHLMWGANSPAELDLFPGTIEIAGFRFESIETPGHSRDHTVYLESNNGWLFAGDIYLSHQIKYFRADEHIDEQINSLRKVLDLDFESLFCGHHPRPENGKEYIRQKLQYLEDFYGKVAVLATDGMDAAAIMKALKLKEQRLVKWICFGNVSMKNMVRSVMRAEGRG